jgi:uncharacterized repeat protein (TIGR01451 family)
MKFSFNFRLLAAFAVALMLAGTKVEAQQYFGLSVSNSAGSILVSNSLTYTITVTNLAGDLTSAYTFVTNTLSPSVQFESATPSFGGAVTNYGNLVVFNLGGLEPSSIVQISLTVQPTSVGLITNQIFVSFSTVFVTYTAATNVVTQVTNMPLAQADLGVAITVPTTAIITNDLMIYGVSVTNSGPSDAPGVMLTNALPPGVVLLGVLPAQPGYSVVSSNMIFSLGTLTSGNFTNFQFTIQPTNVGTLNFSASVGAPGVVDPNLTNNTTINSIAITNYLAGTLTASVTSTQIYNPQNGLVEQSITVSNAGLTSVSAARVVVTGLAGQRLYNNVGTNSGNPFVVYAPGLASGQSVNLLLQFFAANYFTLANSQLQAFAVPVPNLSPPPISSASPALVITRVIPLANGKMLLEFPSIPGRTYTVVFSDNVLFSNAMIAPPSFVAPVTPMQWVDYGPPATASLPATAPARFYRVILNP